MDATTRATEGGMSMTIGERIIQLRNENGITDKELAERLCFVASQGMSGYLVRLRKWEREELKPMYKMLPRIAEAFGMTLSQLFEGVDR